VEHGQAQRDLEPLFARLDKDTPGSLDGVHDQANMSAATQPDPVLSDLEAQNRN
jgi:hypothetical protein